MDAPHVNALRKVRTARRACIRGRAVSLGKQRAAHGQERRPASLRGSGPETVRRLRRPALRARDLRAEDAAGFTFVLEVGSVHVASNTAG